MTESPLVATMNILCHRCQSFVTNGNQIVVTSKGVVHPGCDD